MKKLLYIFGLTLLLNSCEKDNTNNNNNTGGNATLNYNKIEMRVHRDIEDLDWPWDYVINKDGSEEFVDVYESGEFLATAEIDFKSIEKQQPNCIKVLSDTIIYATYNEADEIKTISYPQDGIDLVIEKSSSELSNLYYVETNNGIDSNILIGYIKFRNGQISSIEYLPEIERSAIYITNQKGFNSTFSQKIFSLFTYRDQDDFEWIENFLIAYYNEGGLFLFEEKLTEEEDWTVVNPNDLNVTFNESNYPTRIDYKDIKRIWTATYQ